MLSFNIITFRFPLHRFPPIFRWRARRIYCVCWHWLGSKSFDWKLCETQCVNKQINKQTKHASKQASDENYRQKTEKRDEPKRHQMKSNWFFSSCVKYAIILLRCIWLNWHEWRGKCFIIAECCVSLMRISIKFFECSQNKCMPRSFIT